MSRLKKFALLVWCATPLELFARLLKHLSKRT